MDLNKFIEQIEHPRKRAKDFMEDMAIRAIIHRTLRIAMCYPELAQEYLDQLPKATMDENK